MISMVLDYIFSKKTFFRTKVLNDKIQILENKIKVTDNINEIIIENKNIINHQLTLNNLHCEKLAMNQIILSIDPKLSIGLIKK